MKHNTISDGKQLVLLANPDERDVISMFDNPNNVPMATVKKHLDPLLGQNGLEWKVCDTLTICRIGEPQTERGSDADEWVYLGRFPAPSGTTYRWYARVTDVWHYNGSPGQLLLQLRDQGQAIFEGGAV